MYIRKFIRFSLYLSMFFVGSCFLTSTTLTDSPKKNPNPLFLAADSLWVDSVFNSLSPDERIAQMFMIAAYSNKPESYDIAVAQLIKNYKVGGVLFFQGGPVKQAKLTNYFQSISKTPMLVAIDGEWGLAMRLDSCIAYPRQMMLGAINDEKLIYEMGAEIARQCKLIGVNVNFAPVVDVNVNAANPVINARSFGENKQNVAKKATAYMLGMQDNGVMASAKHFPGHGDTETDSHLATPVIMHSIERIDSVELFPFKKLISNGLASVMVGHLHIPSMDSAKNSITSISKKIITGWLRDSLKFNGLVFTDAMNMKGLAANNLPGEVDVKAVVAGNDILLMPDNVSKALEQIKKAVESGRISQADIDKRCKRILKAKYWLGLNKYKPVKTNNIISELNNSNAKLINRKLIEASITLLKNRNDIIPLKNLDTLKIASISIGSGNVSVFSKTLGNYTKIQNFAVNKKSVASQFDALLPLLKNSNLVIVGIHSTSWYPNSYGITEASINFVKKLAKTKKVILNVFGNPYSLAFFDISNLESLILSYEDSQEANELSAQLIFGGIKAQGKIPVSPNKEIPENSGIIIGQKIRLKYGMPSEVDLQESILARIDTIAKEGIDNKAYPGCQVLIAKNGVVCFQKSYGNMSYIGNDTLTNDKLFDLASVTKISATIPALMKLCSEKKFDINQTLNKYLPILNGTNKSNLLIKDVLAHQARLKEWIPFHLSTYPKDTLNVRHADTSVYHKTPDNLYSVQIADSQFMRKDYQENIYRKIFDSNLYKNKKYRYSDNGLYLLRMVVDSITKEPFDEYLSKNFYQPLGATTMCFNPLNRFPKTDIVPTENDTLLRKQLLQGYVHDHGAAMLGGISGHAGLFSNSNDMAKLLQMYLQKGNYGGKEYFSAKAFDLFNYAHFKKTKNYRGLGFDKPRLNSVGKPLKSWLSETSFGHTGFTGTYVWVDPAQEIILVFLSNRVCPNAENEIFTELGTRSKIHKTIYDAIIIPDNRIVHNVN